jgi:hypothetical protein
MVRRMARARDSGWRRARRELVDAICAGRISDAEAARELGVSRSTVAGWVGSDRASGRPRFVAVDVAERGESPPGGAAMEVVLDHRLVVRVPRGCDAGEVARLVRALRSC